MQDDADLPHYRVSVSLEPRQVHIDLSPTFTFLSGSLEFEYAVSIAACLLLMPLFQPERCCFLTVREGVWMDMCSCPRLGSSFAPTLVREPNTIAMKCQKERGLRPRLSSLRPFAVSHVSLPLRRSKCLCSHHSAAIFTGRSLFNPDIGGQWRSSPIPSFFHCRGVRVRVSKRSWVGDGKVEKQKR